MAFSIVEELCIGCVACLKVCPVDCITGATKRLHWIDAAACIDCAACGIVCPTEAVFDPGGTPVPFIKRRADRPVAVVDEVFCSGCDFCSDICPFDCLAIDRVAETPQATSIVKMVAPKACIACRLCEDVCQKNAIAVRYPDGRPFVPIAERSDDRSQGDPVAA